MNNLSPGFSTLQEAQICFRAVLEAFSTPGLRVALPVALKPPCGLSSASAALLLTLADAHTKISLPDNSGARDWLVFHTGAPLTALETADFCVATKRPALASLLQGTDEAPESGATLILDVEDLNGPTFRLSGPGLQMPVTTKLPLDKDFVREWQAQTRTAPRGVDIILCAQNRLLALPRSLHIEEG